MRFLAYRAFLVPIIAKYTAAFLSKNNSLAFFADIRIQATIFRYF